MDGEVKAISLAGIVHNETKIGVQDGMCEDLVNLRFKDGSWRTSGDGDVVATLSETYAYLYVHTNVYRHLLGTIMDENSQEDIPSGVLYWVGDISDAGVVTMKETAVAITNVKGDVTITQTGHLITVIDQADDFEYFIYKTSEDAYVEVNVDVNGKQSDRTLYPFGQVHFNCHCPFDKEHVFQEKIDNGSETIYQLPVYYETIKSGIKKKNQFAQPFLAVAAFKLYDGSYVYASPPTLIHPREKMNYLPKDNKGLAFPNYFVKQGEGGVPATGSGTAYLSGGRQLVFENGGTYNDDYYTVGGTDSITTNKIEFSDKVLGKNSVSGIQNEELGFQDDYDYDENHCLGAFINMYSNYGAGSTAATQLYCALGSDLCLSIDESIKENLNDAIVSLCIFVTPEVDIFEVDNEGKLDLMHYGVTMEEVRTQHGDSTSSVTKRVTHLWRSPELRDEAKVIYDLARSQFFLLREYNKSSIQELLDNPIIDLTAPEYEGLLENLVHNETLPTEAMGRTTYLPKVVYNYNGRLHFANYTASPFHGYPLDMFQKNNHSVKYLANGNYLGFAHLADNNDHFLQWDKGSSPYESDSAMRAASSPMAFAVVEIDTDNGIQKVVRYIAAGNGVSLGREKLGALLTYPDYRAQSITIYWYDATPPAAAGNYVFRYKKFDLKPLSYLNTAYYFDPELKPISWEDMTSLIGVADVVAIDDLVKEINVIERYPNGLKVSDTDNPLYFPVNNTYQVGSAKILALCSNTIAVGTGQTGDAPLYVFCEDGVYALFVDASGLMAYPNARAIARDVLNNPRSVTPTDNGVVFTTDRGLMMIAGEQVHEIGQPLEGDILQYHNSNKPTDYNSICAHAYHDARTPQLKTRLADLRSTSNAAVTFLDFLKNSVINYNHNEWELMVSNPSYTYTYVMDRHGNWSRRDYGADMYVNNYPTSYRVWNNSGVNRMYQVDVESDANNGMFFMTREIKLDSIGFKSLQRVVARGFFATLDPYTSPATQAQVPSGTIAEPDEVYYLGLYVFGSHDSRKWACLGHKERTGNFTDIGCLVERTDCKFFRIVMAGQLKKDSRLDYIEMSAKPSILNTKIR